jgi:hypothetical protein
MRVEVHPTPLQNAKFWMCTSGSHGPLFGRFVKYESFYYFFLFWFGHVVDANGHILLVIYF